MLAAIPLQWSMHRRQYTQGCLAIADDWVHGDSPSIRTYGITSLNERFDHAGIEDLRLASIASNFGQPKPSELVLGYSTSDCPEGVNGILGILS